jgi:CrcB protein
MPIAVGIAFAGAAGAVLRYLVDGLISNRAGGAFPWGTFVVNISGSLVLGFLFAMATTRLGPSPLVRSMVLTGFLGAYTTFSTLTLETARLLQNGAYVLAAFNSVGSLAVGMAAVFVGIFIGKGFA